MSLWTKARKKIGHAVKSVGKGLTSAVVDPLRATGHALEAGVNLLQGDLGAAGKNITKAYKESVRGGLNLTTGGTTSKLNDKIANAAAGVMSYGLLNFNEGSQYMENATGWDIDNSKAEAKERAAQAAYQAEVNAANEAEARNRRANLLSLRKSLTPSLSRSTQGGAGSNTIDKSQGGIILG